MTTTREAVGSTDHPAAPKIGDWRRFRACPTTGIGLAVRKYVLAKRGAIASPALRKPGAALSAADVADVERLVARQTKRLAEIGASPIVSAG